MVAEYWLFGADCHSGEGTDRFLSLGGLKVWSERQVLTMTVTL